jgi:hypothetical protein
MRLNRVLLLATASLVVCGKFVAWGKFAMPTNAPVERLVSNMADYVKAHPRDANGYYTLGRIHYLAFTLNSTEIPDPELQTSRYPGRPAGQPRDPGEIPEAQRATHLKEAVRLLQRALELDPKNGLYELGLACVLEDGQPDWRELAIAHYLVAYLRSIAGDQQITRKPLHGLHSLVSYEAGSSYLRLVNGRGPKDAEKAAVKQIEEKIAAMDKLPRGPISPIVLSLRSGAALSDLLAPELRVNFDLDGTGRAQSYSWLRPDTALLIWDPQHTGKITSGRQLFGNVTWWMFWENGYQALAALDDDHDGWLRGPELAGLALWFDRNQNGVCDPGEVVPMEQSGVEALAVRASGWDGESPMNANGVRMKDGNILPTWDWVTTPVHRSPDLCWRRWHSAVPARTTVCVGQPILAAAGFPAGWSGLCGRRGASSKAGCRQDCLPHNGEFMQRISRRLFLAGAAAGARLFAQKDTTFTSDVNVVNVFATVRNKQGQIVRDLKKEDFSLDEEGRPQTIRYFSQESDLPLPLGLLIDTSGSQRRVLGQERAASYKFLKQVAKTKTKPS